LCSFGKERVIRIYVGNLSRETTGDELRALFEDFGQVADVNIIRDRMTGESRGFAFIEMPSQNEAEAAIEGLNGREVHGRSMRVNVARPRREGRPRGRGFDDRHRRW